jgi:hypothetical protein
MLDTVRKELLEAVAKCWPHEAFTTSYACDYPRSTLLDPQRMRREDLFLRGNDIEDAPACFLMLDEMFVRDCYGFGPPVVVELTGGSPNEWYCRRVVCPDSDAPFTTHEEKGATKAEAIARAFVAIMSETSATTKSGADSDTGGER